MRKTSMLSLGIVGAVSAIALGCHAAKGEYHLACELFGSAGMLGAKSMLFAPIELVRLRL